ncbi:splicing factor 3B subunit 2-like [Oscarella lobularis]|uniref:splicing factor 3B subunit 2-like n=1 Tax=Oscarella lobularis TaxID=121494 RepID=UPI00331352D0
MAANMSPQNLRKNKVPELRALLTKHNLSTAGRKEELVQRLADFFDKEQTQTDGTTSSTHQKEKTTETVESGPPEREPDFASDSGVGSGDQKQAGSGDAAPMETETSAKGVKTKKKKKKRRRAAAVQFNREENENEKPDDVEIEYVSEPAAFDESNPIYADFSKIFEAFKIRDPAVEPVEQEETKRAREIKAEKSDSSDDDEGFNDQKKPDGEQKLSKKKMKKMMRMGIADLKQKVVRPDLVEMHDVTAKDPVLLLDLKSTRNTVPVPRHWCFKRKYLAGKRGFVKQAFELPDFIKKTGIVEMREALQEKESQKSLKAKTRERVRPKMGRMNVDYQKLHDAFFRWQTKPLMTIHGDLYYEGKEFETRLKEKKPGDLSDDLKTSLGMPVGPGSERIPPPWLIAMQRYGPPPSYPNLRIPGLNAPVPDGCSFGYHPGGWGKPPVDEQGRPLYGDVFGTDADPASGQLNDEVVDKTLWGELESESEEEMGESDEEDSDEGGDEEGASAGAAPDESGIVTPAEGLTTPSGMTSIPGGLETPEMIELRKRKTIEEAMEQSGEAPALFTVLPEKKSSVGGGAMMGSSHVYDVGKKGADGIEVSLDPTELDMDQAAMTAKYERQMKEKDKDKEDLSDMVAEHTARQNKKRKRAAEESSKSTSKKHREFKF